MQTQKVHSDDEFSSAAGTDYGDSVQFLGQYGALWVKPWPNADFDLMVAFAKEFGESKVNIPGGRNRKLLARRLMEAHLTPVDYNNGAVKFKKDQVETATPVLVPMTAAKPKKREPTEKERRAAALAAALQGGERIVSRFRDPDNASGDDREFNETRRQENEATPVAIAGKEEEEAVLDVAASDERVENECTADMSPEAALVYEIQDLLWRIPLLYKGKSRKVTATLRARRAVLEELKKKEVTIEYLERVAHNLRYQLENHLPVAHNHPTRPVRECVVKEATEQPSDDSLEYVERLKAAGILA